MKRTGLAVIISGKQDFKYFMLLKLAAKRKPKNTTKFVGRMAIAAGVDVAVMAGKRDPSHGPTLPGSETGQQDSSDQAGWLAGNLSHFDFCSSVITS